jgi:plastocyanin
VTSPRGHVRRALRLAALLLLPASIALAAPAKHTVVIEAVKYDPPTLTVKQGDAVTWVNHDPYPHTVTSRGAFDSKDIPADGKWTYVARKPGRYDYICTLHPNMKGTLVVTQGPPSTPSSGSTPRKTP